MNNLDPRLVETLLVAFITSGFSSAIIAFVLEKRRKSEEARLDLVLQQDTEFLSFVSRTRKVLQQITVVATVSAETGTKTSVASFEQISTEIEELSSSVYAFFLGKHVNKFLSNLPWILKALEYGPKTLSELKACNYSGLSNIKREFRSFCNKTMEASLISDKLLTKAASKLLKQRNEGNFGWFYAQTYDMIPISRQKIILLNESDYAKKWVMLFDILDDMNPEEKRKFNAYRYLTS